MKSIQDLYKSDHESQEPAMTFLAQGQVVFIDCHPLTSFADEGMVPESGKKLELLLISLFSGFLSARSTLFTYNYHSPDANLKLDNVLRRNQVLRDTPSVMTRTKMYLNGLQAI